jgi:Tfp pilus assembly protein PilF
MSDISQTSRVVDARQELESRVFDVVVCDYHFDNNSINGQELLDDLRQAQLLPFSTVFIMVTGECSYLKVAEAAESALDGYLVKPHTAFALEERIVTARHRKRTLSHVFAAIQAGDFAAAAQMCVARYRSREDFWLYAARIGAELFLQVGDVKAAKQLYHSANEAKPAAWAALGLARAELASGSVPKATRLLDELLAEDPGYADAHDVMAQIHLEQGHTDMALGSFRSALQITPQSIPRLQKHGMLSFFSGNKDDAMEDLDRTVRLGLKSKMFDAQSLVLLCLVYFDKKDSKEFKWALANLTMLAQKKPESLRLQRFVRNCEALLALIERKPHECTIVVADLSGEIRGADFDYEAATNLLALLVRVRRAAIDLPHAEQWVQELSQRYCVSKVSCEMLCLAADGDESFSALIHEGHHSISSMAEQAMTHSVSGQPMVAVESLLVGGSQTGNAKLIELAGAVLSRQAANIGSCDKLSTEVNDLKSRYCTQGSQFGLGQSQRSAGGLKLRA